MLLERNTTGNWLERVRVPMALAIVPPTAALAMEKTTLPSPLVLRGAVNYRRTARETKLLICPRLTPQVLSDEPTKTLLPWLKAMMD